MTGGITFPKLALGIGTAAILTFGTASASVPANIVAAESSTATPRPGSTPRGEVRGSNAKASYRLTSGSGTSSAHTGRALSLANSSKVDDSQIDKAIMTTLAALTSLEDGFLGQGSVAPSEEVMARLVSAGTDLVGKQIVPSWRGGVVVEWEDRGCDFTAEIEPDGNLFLCVDNTETDELREIETTYSTPALHLFLTTGTWNV